MLAVEYYGIWLLRSWLVVGGRDSTDSRRQGARRLFRRLNLSLFALVEKGSHGGGRTLVRSVRIGIGRRKDQYFEP